MNSRATSRSPFSRNLYSRNPFCQFFFAPDTGAGEAGGAPNPAPPAPSGKSVAEQVQDAISELLGKKNGDPNAAMATLIKQNYALEKRAVAAEQAAMSKADTEAFAAFKALGLSVDDVKKKLEEHTQWGEERAKNAKLDGLKKAAAAAGYNADLLASLEGALDADYIVSGEGESAKVIVKVTADGTTTDKALDDFVSERWPAVKDVLKAGNAGGAPQVAKYGQSAGVQTGKAAANIYDQIREHKAAENKQAQTSGHWTERVGAVRR